MTWTIDEIPVSRFAVDASTVSPADAANRRGRGPRPVAARVADNAGLRCSFQRSTGREKRAGYSGAGWTFAYGYLGPDTQCAGRSPQSPPADRNERPGSAVYRSHAQHGARGRQTVGHPVDVA